MSDPDLDMWAEHIKQGTKIENRPLSFTDRELKLIESSLSGMIISLTEIADKGELNKDLLELWAVINKVKEIREHKPMATDLR